MRMLYWHLSTALHTCLLLSTERDTAFLLLFTQSTTKHSYSVHAEHDTSAGLVNGSTGMAESDSKHATFHAKVSKLLDLLSSVPFHQVRACVFLCACMWMDVFGWVQTCMFSNTLYFVRACCFSDQPFQGLQHRSAKPFTRGQHFLC